MKPVKGFYRERTLVKRGTGWFESSEYSHEWVECMIHGYKTVQESDWYESTPVTNEVEYALILLKGRLVEVDKRDVYEAEDRVPGRFEENIGC